MSLTDTQVELLEASEGEMFSPSDLPSDEWLAAVANRVRDGLGLIVTKLTQLGADLGILRARFAARPRGHADFMGYQTWESFVTGYLHYSPRRVQQILRQLLADPKTSEETEPETELKSSSPVADAKAEELTKLLTNILGNGQARVKPTCQGKLNFHVVRYGGFKVTLLLNEQQIRTLAAKLEDVPPQQEAPEPWKERFGADVIAQAEAEMRGAIDLANSLPKAGRYFSETLWDEHPLAGRYNVKAGERPGGTWSGIRSQKENIAGQFPWFSDPEISVSRLQSALETKGVDYKRIVSRIAAGIQAEREAARFTEPADCLSRR